MMILRPVVAKFFFRGSVYLERHLPQEGEIVCRVGDKVKPFDILGSTFISLDRKSWRIDCRRWQIRVTDGLSLNAGDVLAQRKGLWSLRRELLRMPFSGTVSVLDEDHMTKIEAFSFPEKYSLVSGINAQVVKVVEKSSVLLETPAYVVEAALSSGKEAIGEIKSIGTFSEPILLSQLGPELTGKIVVGGSYVSQEVVNKAQALGVAALVVGGVGSQIDRSNLPVFVTEGYGRIPMNRKVWDFLESVQLKTAIVIPQRRQLIVPTKDENPRKISQSEVSMRELKVGDLVQVFVWPSFGFFGQVIEMGNVSSRLPSGVEDFIAKVRMDKGEVIDVPVSNIGILG